jgi:hypothetical protein
VSVSIKNGEFRWIPSSTGPILQDMDLQVTKGGYRHWTGRRWQVLATWRHAWEDDPFGRVRHHSRRNRIFPPDLMDSLGHRQGQHRFGHCLDPDFYERVLDACALRADLAVLPQGHMIEVGEKGVCLFPKAIKPGFVLLVLASPALTFNRSMAPSVPSTRTSGDTSSTVLSVPPVFSGPCYPSRRSSQAQGSNFLH